MLQYLWAVRIMRNCKKRVSLHCKCSFRKKRMTDGVVVEMQPPAWYYNRWNVKKPNDELKRHGDEDA